MQNTTNTLILGFMQSGWTEVYSGTYSIPGTGWQFFTLATPFTYAGANLLIEICFNNSSNASSSTVLSTPVGEQIWHQHSDLPNGNGCTDLTAGAVQVNSLEELMDTTVAFLFLKPPKGQRVAVLGMGGGISVYAADTCARERLELPVLSAATRDELKKFIPVAGGSIQEAPERGLNSGGVSRRMSPR